MLMRKLTHGRFLKHIHYSIELTWDDFFKFKKFNKRMNNYNISLTNKLFDEVKVVFDSKSDD